MILKLTIAVIALYLFYRLARAWKRVGAPPKTQPIARGEDLVEDPQCHTYVPMTHARKVDIEGKTVYFCSEKCLAQYKAERKER